MSSMWVHLPEGEWSVPRDEIQGMIRDEGTSGLMVQFVLEDLLADFGAGSPVAMLVVPKHFVSEIVEEARRIVERSSSTQIKEIFNEIVFGEWG